LVSFFLHWIGYFPRDAKNFTLHTGGSSSGDSSFLLLTLLWTSHLIPDVRVLLRSAVAFLRRVCCTLACTVARSFCLFFFFFYYLLVTGSLQTPHTPLLRRGSPHTGGFPRKTCYTRTLMKMRLFWTVARCTVLHIPCVHHCVVCRVLDPCYLLVTGGRSSSSRRFCRACAFLQLAALDYTCAPPLSTHAPDRWHAPRFKPAGSGGTATAPYFH